MKKNEKKYYIKIIRKNEGINRKNDYINRKMKK